MDELMGFGWERLGKYALCTPESQEKKWLMGGAARATITRRPQYLHNICPVRNDAVPFWAVSLTMRHTMNV